MANISSNFSITDSEEKLKKLNDELALRYLPVMIHMFLLIFTGFFGNILVIVVYVRKKVKTATHYFIVNLALMDLLTVVIGMPTEIADLRYPYMFYASWLCKSLRAVESLSTMGSIITLMTVAKDRYSRICKFCKQMTAKKAKRLCLMAVLIGVITCWPAAVVFGKKTRDIGIPGVLAADCSTDDSMKGTKYPLVYYGSLFLFFIACVIFVSVIYTRIIIYIRRQRKKSMLNSLDKKQNKPVCGASSLSNETNFTDIEKESSSVDSKRKDVIDDKKNKETKHSNNRQTRTSKTTLMLGIVTVVFVVSFLPFLTVMVVRNIVKTFEQSLSPAAEVVYKFCLKSYFINNAANPVIYGFMNIQFREDVKILFRHIRNAFQNCKS